MQISLLNQVGGAFYGVGRAVARQSASTRPEKHSIWTESYQCAYARARHHAHEIASRD